MSVVEFLSQPLWQRLGLTLVHFLWQGLAVAVLVGALVKVFRLKHGNVRYGAYLLAFIAMIACPVVTFTAIDITISPNTELVTGAESAEVVETFSYTALPAGDILPEAETSSPVMPTVTESIPLGQRISDWLNVSMPWVLVIWMVGVVVLSVRLLMGFVGVYRWRHHLQPLPERLVQRIASLSERLRMRGFSRVFISPTVLQAMAVGYLRPMVLLPAAMVARMQPEMLEAVIAHELAHIRRFDLWINLAQRVTETLLFYHPAVWWLSNCIRRERELCCDELAVKATGRRLTYATTLESVGRAKVMAKQPVLAAGLGRDNKPTLGRVRHILGLRPTKRNCPFWLAGVITVLFLAALVIPTGFALTARSKDKSAVPVEIQEKKDQKELSKFKTTLPNGVTVELVGICEHPSEGKQWWLPDGSLLGQSPVRNIDVGGYSIPRGEAAYELVAKLTGPETLLSRSSTPEKWKVSQALKVGLGKSGTAKDKSGKPCLRVTTAIVKDGLEKIDIEFGLAGVWEKRLTISSNESSKQEIRDTGVVINPPYEKNSNATITIKIPNKIDSKMAINITAVLKNGKVIDRASWDRNSKFSFMRSTDNYEFHRINLSDVDHFEIYTSKYQWVTFKNVSLKSNFKTAVPVEGENESLIPKQDESSKEFFGITDALAVSDISGHLTIKSIHVAGLDGKKLISNKTSIFVDVVNSSDREVNLLLEYYTDSGTIAWFFSPGASAKAKVLKVRPNWQGQLEFPMNYSRFAKGGYVKIILARCSSDHIESVRLAQSIEVIHEKQYGVISVGQQKQVVRLLDTLRTAKGRKQLGAAEELAKYGRSVVPALTEMLQNDNVWAAHALGLIGPEAEDAVPALIKSLRQGADGGVRGFSASALRQIGPAAIPAIPALIGTLKDKNGNTRMHAAEALGYLSTGEKDVIEALTAALQDEDETVRKAAGRSLKRIEDTISISTAEETDQVVAVPDDYIATLPNGVTVELVGVCGHPSLGKQWWWPDGTLLPQAPFGDTGSWIPVMKDRKSYKVAVRLLNLPVTNNSTTFNYKHRYSAGRTHYFSGFKSVNVEPGKRTHNMTLIYVPVVPSKQEGTDFGFAIAGGQWTTDATTFTDPSKNASAKTHDNIIMKTPFEEGDETIICVSFPRLDKAHRVIATDINGQTHRMDGLAGGLSPDGGISQYTYRIKKPLAEIVSFASQTQEFQWIEFKNVSLRPGMKTDVQVEVKEREVDLVPAIRAVDNNVTLACGLAVELLGLTRIPIKDNPWWKPDGSPVDEPPLEWVGTDPSVDSDWEQFNYYAVDTRLKGKPADKLGQTKWLFTGANGYAQTAYSNENVLAGLVRFPKDVKTTTLHLGIVGGRWETLFAFKDYGSYRKGKDSIAVSRPYGPHGPRGSAPDEKGLYIRVVYNVTDRDVRIVAVDKNGKEHLSSTGGSGGTDEIRRTIANFRDLTKEKLREYRFQVRGYEWIEFKDISLRPSKEAVALAEQRSAKRQQEIEEWLGRGQTRQIRRQILVLRESYLHNINEPSLSQVETISAIQELVGIDAPAVPELITELRQTENWMTKSLIAFVLRAIGDERAVPALIEVLGQSKYRGGYGIYVKDDKLAEFMLDNQYYSPDESDRKAKQIIIAGPVIEITKTLEKITGHSEGPDSFSPEAAEVVKSRWQKWWEDNEKKTDAQVEGGKEALIENIIEAVRQAQRPAADMSIHLIYTRYGNTVTRRYPGGGDSKYQEDISIMASGIRSRVERQYKHYREELQEWQTTLSELSVYNGHQFRKLRTIFQSGLHQKYQGTQDIEDRNAGILSGSRVGMPFNVNHQEVLSTFTFELQPGPAPGIYILDAIRKRVRRRLTIDGNRGFNVIKVQALLPDGSLNYETNFKLQQYGDIWYPCEFSTVRFGILECTTEFKSVEFNIVVDDEMFDLDFPAGTEVRDLILNTLHFTGQADAPIAEIPGDLPSRQMTEPFHIPPDLTNVALNKPVSSSDHEPIIGEIEMITDGDRTASAGSYVELHPSLQYVTIDLGSEHNIYAIVVWHFHKQARVYFDVVVQVTSDPDFTSNVTTVFNNDIDNSLGLGVGKNMHYVETNEGKLIDCNSVEARYIRLYSRGNTSNNLNHYVEVEVYAKSTEESSETDVPVDGEVEFELITRPLTIKGIELQLSRVATLQYWNEVFDLDSEMISHYEPGAWRWPKGADIGFDIDFPQEIRGSVNWGINIGYKTTGHRFLALDSYSFEQAVWETSTKLDELRNSKWMGFGLSKLTLTKFPEFFAVLTDGYSVKADSTVEHPSPKLAIIEVVEAGDKSAEIKYWLERKTQNKPDVQVEAEGIKTEIQKLVNDFWTAVMAKDWQAVNEYSEMDILKQRAGALEDVLAEVGGERKRALSRGMNISRIDEVYVEGKEAVAIGPANRERFQWYYLQKRGDVWVIKLFDDAPRRLSVQDVFFKCRSVDKLVLMGERLSIYAAEHQGKLPENLEALEPYIPDKMLRAWLRKHVEYLGKGKEMEKIPNSTAAYTRTLVSKDENISVLYNDGNVDFVLTSQVERAK